MEATFKHAANCTGDDIGMKIANQIKSGQYWEKKINLVKEEDTREEEREGAGHKNDLQDFNKLPIIVGGDVEALYPSLEHIPTSKILYKAMMETDVNFESLDYGMMSIYLFLVLGGEGMKKHGLKRLPQRTKEKDSAARSLLSKVNREKDDWDPKEGEFTDEDRRSCLL